VIEVNGIRAIVTDIEGTTSSLAFVKDVLFPYARRTLPDFVRGHQSQLTDFAGDMAAIVGKPRLDTQEMIDLLLQWMDEDRKVTPLKTLQGMVWKTGYENGELQSHLYEDAARGLRKWHGDGLRLYVYSSGSIAAQKLLFAHTPYGDLRPLFDGYFDTTTGPKLESHSYQAIGAALALPPREIVFLSDHAGEIQAATAAGWQTVLLTRERTEVSPEFARDFDDIQLRSSREN
jgi:enolase-phosphatase E1